MATWRGNCGVCNTQYQYPEYPKERPNATFCPECRKTGMMAPGVVNWSKYEKFSETLIMIVIREIVGGERYARDYEYCDRVYRERAIDLLNAIEEYNNRV